MFLYFICLKVDLKIAYANLSIPDFASFENMQLIFMCVFNILSMFIYLWWSRQLSFILPLIKLRYNLLLVVYFLVLKCNLYSERTFILEKTFNFLHIYLKRKRIFNIIEVVISDYFNIFCKKHKLTSFLNILFKKENKHLLD